MNVTLPLCDMNFLAPPTGFHSNNAQICFTRNNNFFLGGSCFVVSDSDSDCDIFPLSTALIQCQFVFTFLFSFSFFSTLKNHKNNRDWEVGCSGRSTVLTTQIFRASESDTGSFIALDTPSTTMENEFLGIFFFFSFFFFFFAFLIYSPLVSDEDTRIIVQVCNAAVCVKTENISLTICEENEEQREENIQLVLGNVNNFFPLLFLKRKFSQNLFADPRKS